MCSRMSFTDAPGSRWVRERFGVADPPDRPPPRFNIAPTDPVLTIGRDRGGEPVGRCSAGTCSAGGRPLEGARVLVLADGFYEWLHAEAPKQPKVPLRFHVPGQPAFAFAGVRTRSGCAIFTTTANELVLPVHDRMPVILDDHAEESDWLDPKLDAPAAATLLDPLPATRMHAERASSRVNDVRAEGPELWQPDPPETASTLF